MTDMESMYSEQAKKAADNFIFSIKTGEIRVEKRPNHGKDYRGGFKNYLKIFLRIVLVEGVQCRIAC
jgi:hypothetical protein